MTDGRTTKFREGWALRIGSWGKAHYYLRDQAGPVKSVCGRSTASAGALFNAGNWRRCSLCERHVIDPLPLAGCTNDLLGAGRG